MNGHERIGGLRLFARLVPAGERQEWLQEWEGEIDRLARERGCLDRRTRIRLQLAAVEDASRLAVRRLSARGALHDLRHALRSLRTNPGYSVVALLTLAVGIGANAAIFTVVDSYLLRPLPLHEPQRLFTVQKVKEGRLNATSAPNFIDWRERNSSFTDLVGLHMWAMTLTGVDTPRRLSRAAVTPGFFSLLGVDPALGRGFTDEEAVVGRHEVVVLSHDLWASAFGTDPKIIGRSIVLNGSSYVVVGVAPRGFRVPPFTADIWVPLAFTQDALEARGRNNIWVLGRLADGVTREAAQAEMEILGVRLADAYPDANEGWGIALQDLHAFAVGGSPRGLWVLLAAVGLVLLIACANVANLTIARGAMRERELAVRVALGASRARLLRQLLVESLVLSLAGGALGVGLAYLLLEPVASLVPSGLRGIGELSMDLAVLAFAFVVSALAGVAAGAVPGLRISHAAASGWGRIGVAGALRKRGSSLEVRGALVVTEFALAMILLVGAGLFLRTLSNLYSVDLGLRHEGLTTFSVTYTETDYPSPEDVMRGVDRLLAEMTSRGDVDAVAATSHLPLSGARLSSSVILEGGRQKHDTNSPSAAIKVVTPDYFETLGIPLMSGRVFSDDDVLGTEPVVLLNLAAAERYWPGQDPVGKWLSYTDREGAPVRRRVVGVVGDVHFAGPSRPATAEVYQSYRQTTEVWRWFGRGMSFVVRTTHGAVLPRPDVQAMVSIVDPDLPIIGLRSLADVLDQSVSSPRFQGTLATLFASVALLLAVVGTYGVMAFSVRRRTREIGIRLAIGAGQPAVLREVLLAGARLALLGAVLGAAGAVAVSRSISSLLWGVRGTDPMTYLAVAAVLGGATMLATLAPALRASRLDPMIALRDG